MLKSFEISNYKGFKGSFKLDLKSRNYSFNEHLIRDGLINNALVFSENGAGKSNLGYALFDIVQVLTDKEYFKPQELSNFINQEQNGNVATFKYSFIFNGTDITYEYTKPAPFFLIDEKLYINSELKLSYNHIDKTNNFISDDIKGNVDTTLDLGKLSIIKYISQNTKGKKTYINQMVDFVSHMLYLKNDGNNRYVGYTNGDYNLALKLLELNDNEALRIFMKEYDMNYDTEIRLMGQNVPTLMCNTKNGLVPFSSIASTGQKVLMYYYSWLHEAQDITLLFIDDFDSNLSYITIDKLLWSVVPQNYQSIFTMHNTAFMSNHISRPDCIFLLDKVKLKSLNNLTNKELRRGHNLERMYSQCEFD